MTSASQLRVVGKLTEPQPFSRKKYHTLRSVAMMGFESDFQNTYATNRYHFGVDDANDNDIDDPNKKSRTALVTCACSFCKKR